MGWSGRELRKTLAHDSEAIRRQASIEVRVRFADN
jgi:hypothetical protein